ncbi:MAG: hypothetical protein QXV73_05130 [Candidatus Micrarchaeia archaeon]
MSKYVQLLLTSADEIKALFESQNPDIEDLYDDLITVEKKLEELYRKGYITDFDLLVIACVRTNKSFRKLEREFNISRLTLSNRFKKICEKIAFYLGGYFLDEGYVRKLRKKYRLSNYDTAKLSNYFSRRTNDTV